MENLFIVTSTDGGSSYLVKASTGEDAVRIITEEYEFEYDELGYEEFYLGFGEYVCIDI